MTVVSNASPLIGLARIGKLDLLRHLYSEDERSGRETARHLGLRYAGLIGVLLEAKRRRLIPAIKPQLDSLRDIAGFRIGDTLCLRVLQDQGEM